MTNENQPQAVCDQINRAALAFWLQPWRTQANCDEAEQCQSLAVISNPDEVLMGRGGEGQRYMTVKEAAQLAGVCELTIRRAYRANQLRVQPVGLRGIRISLLDLVDWMARGCRTNFEVAA